MMTTTGPTPLTKPEDPEAGLAIAHIEQVVIEGDLARLKPEERIWYYRKLCQSIGLNPLAMPFRYLTLDGKLVLYCTKNLTDQLRFIHKVSIDSVRTETVGDLIVATATASLYVYPGQESSKRTDTDIGVVWGKGLTGVFAANAAMKAVTKAKRRCTLSICGLGGYLDESELDSVPGATPMDVDPQTGEIRGPVAPDPPSPPELAPPDPDQPPLTPEQATFVENLIRGFDEAETRDEAERYRLQWSGRKPGWYPAWAEAKVDQAAQRARRRLPPRGSRSPGETT